jgi:DNA mismatch repair protein MutS
MVGGVAHSFGLHVARMAGMPHQVLESAEKTLAALEAGSHTFGGKILRSAQNDKSRTREKNTIKPHNIKEGRVESDGSIQLSFFQLEDPLLSSLKDELDKADLNNMTPLQAFDLLRSMKEQLGI